MEFQCANNKFSSFPVVLNDMNTLNKLYGHKNAFKLNPQQFKRKENIGTIGVSTAQIEQLNAHSFKGFGNLTLLIKLNENESIDEYKRKFGSNVTVAELIDLNE